jgi:hypothetical protein
MELKITDAKIKNLIRTFPETEGHVKELFPELFPTTTKVYCGEHYYLQGRHHIFAHMGNFNEYGFLDLATGFYIRNSALKTIVFTGTQRRDSKGYYVEIDNDWLKKYNARRAL